MGMDQYILVSKNDGEPIVLMQWRKHYTLNQLICELFKLDTSNCIVSTKLHKEHVEAILEELDSFKDIQFFKYLHWHMRRFIDYTEDHVAIPDYTYIYQADW